MNMALIKANIEGQNAFRGGLNHRANPHDEHAAFFVHLAWFNGWLIAAVEQEIGEKILVTDQPYFGEQLT